MAAAANVSARTHELGLLHDQIPKDARVTPVYAAALPAHFDWRQKDGYNWMTSVKDQASCGSCVAFAAIGATEGQLKIRANSPSWNVDLSEQHLFSCGGGLCGCGGTIQNIVRITTYVTSLAYRPIMVEVRAKYFPKDPPASTFLVVASLADPAFLVEVDAVAVLD